MNEQQAATLFEALASDARLRLFRLLITKGPEGMVAGDLARALGVSASNLSFHLKTMLHSGLITVQKEGRFLRYRANIPLMHEIVGFLTAECCQAEPEVCQELRKESGVFEAPVKTRRVW